MSAGRGSRQCCALWDFQRDCGDKHYKRHIVLSHFTEIDDQLGRCKPRNKYKSKDVDLHLYPGAMWIFCHNIWSCNATQAGGTNHTAPQGPVYPGLWWGLWSRVLASFNEHPQGLFCGLKERKTNGKTSNTSVVVFTPGFCFHLKPQLVSDSTDSHLRFDQKIKYYFQIRNCFSD